ncbi:MAG: dihydroorotate dehydrogenase electron transfer subunit [Candidatus Bathyarchaeota archaeon]
MRIVEILTSRKENPTVNTLSFKDNLCIHAFPGQFVMVWIPGVDEIPISLSGINQNGLSSITVNSVGDASTALNEKKIGEKIGIRGPFGNGFDLTKGNVLVVGGGTGIGPLMPLTEELVKIVDKITVMSGAKSRNNLLFLDRIPKILSQLDSEFLFTTEDGSYGIECLVTEQVEEKLAEEDFDMIYTCGPEQMMYNLFILAEKFNIPIQVSMERIMRCSIGLCGSCSIGKLRVCKDGPVLNSAQLRTVAEEFGKLYLDYTGKKIKI